MPMWTEQVKLYLGTAPEGSMEDGYSWRKYGQKDILGAKFPRYESFLKLIYISFVQTCFFFYVVFGKSNYF